MNYINTRVMQVITEEKLDFTNNGDLTENLISAIIYKYEDRRKILHTEYRDEIRREAKLEKISSANGSIKIYSPSYDMISYINN